MPDTRKTCAKCRRSLPIREFHAHARSADGRNSYCKGCARESNRAFRERNPGYYAGRAERTLRDNLSRRYGLTVEEVWVLGERQEWRCGVCEHSLIARKPCVDHCHESGAVRGLLCSTCNTALGMLGDTPAGVWRAVRYLVGPHT